MAHASIILYLGGSYDECLQKALAVDWLRGLGENVIQKCRLFCAKVSALSKHDFAL